MTITLRQLNEALLGLKLVKKDSGFVGDTIRMCVDRMLSKKPVRQSFTVDENDKDQVDFAEMVHELSRLYVEWQTEQGMGKGK